jgi:nucleoside-diphosphate-sugar epimerase
MVQTQSLVRKVILASTSNVYGNAERIPIDESLCPAPTNHYAISKLGMEHIAALYADRLDILITRPFNYTGAGQGEHFLIPKIVSHFARKAPFIELGNIDVERDFSDVRWVAQAYVHLLASPVTQGIFNLASGTSVTIRHLIDTLGRLSGHTLSIRQNPEFIRSGEISVLRGSREKLCAALPSLPPPIPVGETLAWMLAEASKESAPC